MHTAKPRTKKKLAVFCDGTWNDTRMPSPTNVSRLAKCVTPISRDGIEQIVFYDDGVGIASHISGLTDELVRIWGGAFGRGLDSKVEAAYRFLVLNFQPEDDIYIFGFSRGAYTARSLCGLIRKCGILKRDHLDKVPEAMEIYRDRRDPNLSSVVQFRATYAQPQASGPEDHPRLGIEHGFDARRDVYTERLEDLFQYRPKGSYRMMYVGLWDTVGSLGVPDRFHLLQFLNSKYDFHDTNASTLLSSVRHAVSIDEVRRVFSSTGVDNIAELNQAWADATHWDVSDRTNSRYVPYENRPYQQRWYPGDHGAVGGGNPQPGLWSHTLLWIAEGARWAGLTLGDGPGSELALAREYENACAPWWVNKDGSYHKRTDTDLLGRIGGFRPRKGPQTYDEVGMSARQRWLRDATYRPENLTVMKNHMADTLPDPPIPSGYPFA